MRIHSQRVECDCVFYYDYQCRYIIYIYTCVYVLYVYIYIYTYIYIERGRHLHSYTHISLCISLYIYVCIERDKSFVVVPSKCCRFLLLYGCHESMAHGVAWAVAWVLRRPAHSSGGFVDDPPTRSLFVCGPIPGSSAARLPPPLLFSPDCHQPPSYSCMQSTRPLCGLLPNWPFCSGVVIGGKLLFASRLCVLKEDLMCCIALCTTGRLRIRLAVPGLARKRTEALRLLKGGCQ